jgi:hypothetical protein
MPLEVSSKTTTRMIENVVDRSAAGHLESSQESAPSRESSVSNEVSSKTTSTTTRMIENVVDRSAAGHLESSQESARSRESSVSNERLAFQSI